jgi:predicted transcriptional regulator with HTH domain
MKISYKKREKIYEQILAYLYSISPKPVFTFNIAQEIARDEEFVKDLLLELRKKNLVVEIKKNPEGIIYLKRSRWKLSDAAYQIYKEGQNKAIKPI